MMQKELTVITHAFIIEDIKRSMAGTQGHLLNGHTWYLREKLYRETVFQRNAGTRMEGEE